MGNTMPTRSRLPRRGAEMSPKEKETLSLLVQGYKAVEIADCLGVTPNYIYALTGLHGLLAARQEPFDAILIDFDLPDLHGTQVGLALYHLMRRKRIKQAPLIALTAQSDKATQEEAGRVGFDAFIAKPCTEDDL